MVRFRGRSLENALPPEVFRRWLHTARCAFARRLDPGRGSSHLSQEILVADGTFRYVRRPRLGWLSFDDPLWKTRLWFGAAHPRLAAVQAVSNSSVSRLVEPGRRSSRGHDLLSSSVDPPLRSSNGLHPPCVLAENARMLKPLTASIGPQARRLRLPLSTADRRGYRRAASARMEHSKRTSFLGKLQTGMSLVASRQAASRRSRSRVLRKRFRRATLALRLPRSHSSVRPALLASS